MTKNSTSWFINRIKETHPNDYQDYKLLSNYVNNHTKVTMLHKPCGKTIEISPQVIMRGGGCRYCGYKRGAAKQSKSIEQAKKEIPPYIHIIGEYKGSAAPVMLHCDRCGNDYMAPVHQFKRRYYCTYCNNRHNETTASFTKEVKELTGEEYHLIGEYTKANEYVTMRHEACGTTYKVTPHNFKQGKRCPRCKRSKGETKILNILSNLRIDYVHPMIFNDLADKNKLHYDFYLPKYNLHIEYQGEQHFAPVKHFGGEHKFSIQVKHDALKRKYAEQNGISLLEIPYTISNYDDIKNYMFNFINTNIGKPRV